MHRLHRHEKQELERILVQHGHQNTDEVLDILEVFLAQENHQTAKDLQHRLKIRGSRHDLEDVQKALDLFTHLGFAQATSIDGREIRYEHKHLGYHHDHLICTRCGRVEDFLNPHIEALQLEAARNKGFIPLEHRMEIYGLCANCVRERGRTVPLSCAEKGECLVIRGHTGGEELQRRLNDMGLTSGTEIEVLGANSGPMIVACRGCRLALGRGMTDKVEVAPADRPIKEKKHKSRPWFRGKHRWRHRG